MTLLENPRQRKAAECQAMAIIIRPLIYCDIMQLSSCLFVCLSLNCANVNVRSSKPKTRIMAVLVLSLLAKQKVQYGCW